MPRRMQPRDSYFTGASNNPSKKGPVLPMKRTDDTNTSNAQSQQNVVQPPPPSVAPVPPIQQPVTNSSLMDRKYEFLENQMKRNNALVQEMVDQKNNARDESQIVITADVLSNTTSYALEDLTGDSDEIAKNTVVKVCYPMRKITTSTGYKVAMRHVRVHHSTGQLTGHWIVVYEFAEKGDTYFVGNYRFA